MLLAETKRQMVQHANQLIIVCDHSKLNSTSLAQFAPSERVDILVVDRLPENSEAWLEAGIALLDVH